MKLEEGLSLIYTRPNDVRVYEYQGQSEPVFYKKHRRKVGLGENFMLGVLNTKTKYIVRLDEEVSLPYCDAMTIMENHPEIKAVYPIYHIMEETEYGYSKTVNIVPYPQGAGIVYDRDAFLEVGGYDTSLDYQADLDFYIRFIMRWGCMVPFAGIYYWTKDGKNRSINHKDKLLYARKKILDKYGLKDSDAHHFGMYHYVR
jgi:hypothetical protein